MNRIHSHHNNHHRNHDHRPTAEPVSPSSCDECPVQTVCDGAMTAAMGVPIVSEQEIFMNMLARTQTPFLFTLAGEDDGCTVIAIPLGDDGEDDGDTFDLAFFFNEYGRCIETALG